MVVALGSAIAGSLGSFGATALGGVVSQGLATVAITAGTSLALSALTPTQKIRQEGARLQNARVTSSTEGATIPKMFGTFRVSGNIIWATRFKEVVVTETSSAGGKGGPKAETTTTTYNYYCSFALGLCQGEVGELTALYFDGNEVNLEDVSYSFYNGSTTQEPDPTIESVEGVGNVPAYRGLSYIVFDELPLETYGNRIPQVSCEITRNSGESSQGLDSIVEELCLSSGLEVSDIDTTDLSDIDVGGYFTEGLVSHRESLEELMSVFFFDVSEVGGKLTFRKRSTPPVHPIELGDFVVNQETISGFEIVTEQEENLPNKVVFTFVDVSKKYSSGSVNSERIGAKSSSTAVIGALVTLEAGEARNKANISLRESYLARDTIRFELPVKDYRDIDCGDYLELEVSGETFILRVTKKEVSNKLLFECVVTDNTMYGDQDIANGTAISVVDKAPTVTSLEFLDLPLLPNETIDSFQPKVSVYQSPWFGGVNIYKEDGSGGHSLFTQALFPSAKGVTTTDLSPGPTDIWDMANTLTIQLENPADNLSSLEDLSVLNGANALALKTPSGEFEVLQFANAQLNGDGTYTISRLLRGQLGTEYYMGDPTPSGSLVAFIDVNRLGTLPVSLTQIGVEQNLRYGPFGFSIDNPVYTDVVYTPKPTAFRTYAPTHLKEEYLSDRINLSWIRRNRFGADPWEQSEVPMSEEVEAYEVDIYDGPTVVRTISTTSPSATYSQTQQIEDFGTEQTLLSWRVYQLSATYGRGTPAIG